MNNKSSTNEIIREYKKLILIYKQSDNIKNMMKINFNEYKNHMYSKFKYFRINYPNIFDIIISNDNIDMLDTMLDSLDNINNSSNIQNDINDIRYKLGNELHNKYVKNNITSNNINDFKFS